jgi:protein-L-isoaspartate(D-aspartate) O-methyltransferase
MNRVIFVIYIIFIIIFISCNDRETNPLIRKHSGELRDVGQEKTDSFVRNRELMVERQIKARGIKNEKVLAALLKVERHLFVPEYLKDSAYIDSPLPIGEGQTISQPYIVALMTELLVLQGSERVLEIGTGSGYQAVILAEIAKEVYTIEIVKVLAEGAQKTIKKLGYKNIKVKYGDGYLGWKEFAPFDRIIVTCAPESIPQPLIEQLSEGGRMVIPVGAEDTIQELQVVEKKQDTIKNISSIPVRFVPMTREVK